MNPEKQQQIMGYFIEEAKDHLTTIENGLLNMQAMLSDPEMVNDVFRAAHSIKGGAAMLGITSVQQTAHRLEDYFKILKENTNIKIDQHLQTLFLQAFDRLQELLEQLQGPFGLTPDAANAVLADSEPIFAQLKTYLHNLVNARVATPVGAGIKSTPKLDSGPLTSGKTAEEARAMTLVFQSDIPTKLRDMLQLFKQPDRPTSRQSLQEICDRLYQAGEQFELKKWCAMISAVKSVVSSQNNPYRVLAPIVIKEIKQAQELVLAQRATDITISSQLRDLMPPSDISGATTHSDDDYSSILGAVVEAENKVVKGWKEFGDRVGWRSNNSWIRTANTSFKVSAPEGHLPAPIWLSAWDKSKDSNADELRNQVANFMSKLANCNLE